jgi:hypothetical protein
MSKWVFVFAVISVSATAQSVNLPVGTEALQSVAGGVQSVSPLCPEGSVCKTNGSAVQLLVQGSGCMDELLEPVVTVIDSENVAVHMQLALNEKSKAALCEAAPLYLPTLDIHYVYPPFRIHFVGTQQVVQVR